MRSLTCCIVAGWPLLGVLYLGNHVKSVMHISDFVEVLGRTLPLLSRSL